MDKNLGIGQLNVMTPTPYSVVKVNSTHCNNVTTSAIDINVRPAARGRLKRPRSDKLSTSAARMVG